MTKPHTPAQHTWTHQPTRHEVREAMRHGSRVLAVTPTDQRPTQRVLHAACTRCVRHSRNGGGCCGMRPTPGPAGRPVGLPSCHMYPDGSMLQPIVHDTDGPRLLTGQARYWRLHIDADGIAEAEPILPNEAWEHWDRERQKAAEAATEDTENTDRKDQQ